MKIFVFLGLICLTMILAAPKSKYTAFHIPASAKQLPDDVRTTFVCSKDGYFADQEFCQIFYICHTVVHRNGSSEMMQWSFICGNRTIFNQFSLTCSYPENAVSCESAGLFWYLNANLEAGTNIPFLNEQDIVSPVAPLAPDRPLPSKVLDLHPTTRPPSMHSPLRPHAMPLLLPPLPPMAVKPRGGQGGMSPTAPPRPKIPSEEEVKLALND